MDKSAVGWEHHEKVDKHESQTGGGHNNICNVPFPQLDVPYRLVKIFILSLCQIIKMALEELLEFRKTELTNLLLAGSIMRRLTSMNHREVMQKMMDQDDFEQEEIIGATG